MPLVFPITNGTIHLSVCFGFFFFLCYFVQLGIVDEASPIWQNTEYSLDFSSSHLQYGHLKRLSVVNNLPYVQVMMWHVYTQRKGTSVFVQYVK